MNLKRLERAIASDRILSLLSTLAKRERVPFFLVGGHLRDLWLGRESNDYDFALPREASFFVGVIEETFQIRFFRAGKDETTTFRIIKDDLSMDITFFQGKDIEEDLSRRDFRINTLAYSLKDEAWHWANGALEDVENRRIRVVSDRSIDQDPLRMLRAIRYLCTLEGFSMDQDLKAEVASKTDRILNVPAERIKVELDHILLSPRRDTGARTLYETGLLLTLFPELKGLQGLRQDEHHHLDSLSHTLLAIEKIPWAIEWMRSKAKDLSFSEDDILCLGYAILFHDIGKQDTMSVDTMGKVHFYSHENFSSQAAQGILERLRFSNPEQDTILCLIRNHMRIPNLPRETRETALKRLVHQIGDRTPLLVLHCLADKEAARGPLSCQNDDVVEKHCHHLLELFKQQEILHPPSLVSGDDVMALGYSPGPRVGQILGLIRQKQVEGEIKTREEALAFLKEFTIDPED
jgi:poly(A) polymerase